MPPTLLHADMDAFYAAVEQRDDPKLRGQPVIVGGRSGRGVVLTASYEARVFGVHSAMPGAHAARLCPQGLFVKPRMWRYAEVSEQIRGVFEEFTPLVEPLSLDEAFLDVTGSLRLFGSPQDLGAQLKRRVRAVTDLAVSVGIGPTKLVAKICSAMCKPDGLLEVGPDDVIAFLHPLPIQYLWGVGPVTEAALRRRGIDTIGDLAACAPAEVRQRFGALGEAFWSMAQGRDGRDVDAHRLRKSYGEEQTFAQDLRDGDTLRRTIATQAESVARRLRADGRRGRTVTLKIKLAQRIGPGKYPVLTRSLTLPSATDDGKTVRDVAAALWDTLRDGTTVRLAGVAVSGIDDEEPVQLSLFPAEPPRRAALNRALDDIAERFGEDKVRRGAAGAGRVNPGVPVRGRRVRDE